MPIQDNVPRETIPVANLNSIKPKEEPKNEKEKKEEIKKTDGMVVLEPLGPGQAYFETPEGEIIIGDSTKSQIWSRKMNGGKGGWANPKR